MSKQLATVVNNRFDEVYVECCGNGGGWYVEWTRDTECGRGLYAARWWGSREACEARKTLPCPPLTRVL